MIDDLKHPQFFCLKNHRLNQLGVVVNSGNAIVIANTAGVVVIQSNQA